MTLVDVWTYTCINCIRTFPYLREWHARYADAGLVIVGLHAPEFEFEKDMDNVVEAAGEHGIVWPIAQDNDYTTWRAYNNRYWPAKYLIDHDGVVRYTHFGEGAYAETEEKIRQLLEEAGPGRGRGGHEPAARPVPGRRFQPANRHQPGVGGGNAGTLRRLSPELQRGVVRGLTPTSCRPTTTRNQGCRGQLSGPGGTGWPTRFTSTANGTSARNRSSNGRTTENYEDYLAVNYSAKSVNAVITSDSGEPYRVRVTMDGEYLTEENKGLDVMIAEDGESFILVDQPRSYALVDNPEYVRRSALRLHPNSPDFGLFAYTFGVYEEGP